MLFKAGICSNSFSKRILILIALPSLAFLLDICPLVLSQALYKLFQEHEVESFHGGLFNVFVISFELQRSCSRLFSSAILGTTLLLQQLQKGTIPQFRETSPDLPCFLPPDSKSKSSIKKLPFIVIHFLFVLQFFLFIFYRRNML